MFVFGMSTVRISVGALAIWTEDFCGFTQSLKENTGIVPSLDHGRFLPYPFRFVINNHPVILRHPFQIMAASVTRGFNYNP
jgi:hypothetical protein